MGRGIQDLRGEAKTWVPNSHCPASQGYQLPALSGPCGPDRREGKKEPCLSAHAAGEGGSGCSPMVRAKGSKTE